MKVLTYPQYGDPAEVLTLTDLPAPEVGPGEALLRMVYSPIHNHDLWTIRGQYGVKPELPARAGSEALCVVEAVGDGVDRGLIGRRVVSFSVLGTWAERFTVPAEGLIPVPDAIPDTAGAQLVAMPFSAITLMEFLNVSEGDWVVQTAANGAVGKIFHDLAKARGIPTLNLVRRPEAVAELTALGFSHVLCTSVEGWLDQAKLILGEGGARAAIDSVSGLIVNDLVELLGRDGLLVSFGSAKGEPMQISPGQMITKHITVKGFWGARVISELDPARKVALMQELIGLVANGQINLPAGGEFPLSEYRAAIAASLTPGRKGKILFRP